MKRLNGREMKALFVLSIVVPVSLLATLRLTGILQGPIAIAETIASEAVKLEFERPSFFDVNIGKKLESLHTSDEASINVSLSVFDYNEAPNEYGSDFTEMNTNLTANISNGYIQNVYLAFHENFTSSQVEFFEISSDPHHQLHKFDNLSIVGYAHTSNGSVKGNERLKGDEKAFIRLASINYPSSIYVRSPVRWILRSPNNQMHQMEMISEVTYFNGTVYKKIIQTFNVTIGSDDNNSFQTAYRMTAGEYGENPMLWLGGLDTRDFYAIYLATGNRIVVSMTPPSGEDFDLYLYNPAQVFETSSDIRGDATESVGYSADLTGWWFIEVRHSGGWGFYNLSIYVNHGAGR